MSSSINTLSVDDERYLTLVLVNGYTCTTLMVLSITHPSSGDPYAI